MAIFSFRQTRNILFSERLPLAAITVLVVLVVFSVWFVLEGDNISRRDADDSTALSRHVKTEWEFVPPNSTDIRRWGCQRTETPFIFVHIGKAGGGSVQTRIEASSLDFSKGKKKRDSYYPVNHNQSMARSCFHCFARHLPSLESSMGGGTEPCHANTPLGQAIACPELLSVLREKIESHNLDCDPRSAHCHIIYSAHNFFGSELHWLPAPYLEQWWSSRWGHKNTKDLVKPLWERLYPNRTWCPSQNIKRPETIKALLSSYESCSIPMQNEVDAKAIQAVSFYEKMLHDGAVIRDWSPVYASLPLLRVTVLRDPFSWLMSKFFWHWRSQRDGSGMVCDNLDTIVVQDNHRIQRPQTLAMKTIEPGWLTRMSLGYIFYLCGEDCMTRYAAGSATLQDLELQAEGNLRQGFAVVGLLQEVDTFYDMVNARVEYINTSLNPNVQGPTHSSGSSPESLRCRKKFNDPAFQQKLLNLSPELSALNHLYQVGIEVNQFQLQELQECSPSSFVIPSRTKQQG